MRPDLGAALFLIGAGLITALGAQTGTAVIEGVVADPFEAWMPGVTVRATNPDLSFEATVRTDPQGAYRFQDLEPGRYMLSAALSGFQPQIFENIARNSVCRCGNSTRCSRAR